MICQKYEPDFVVNSIHGGKGLDFAFQNYPEGRQKAYGAYLDLVKKSLDAPYPYDIVGHIGYIARYVPFEDKSFAGFEKEIDDILLTIIQKDKILEANTSAKGLQQKTLPSEEIVKRYFELGGRKVSYGSDAHFAGRIAENREYVVDMLKAIGFTYITVPFKGEHIKVEI